MGLTTESCILYNQETFSQKPVAMNGSLELIDTKALENSNKKLVEEISIYRDGLMSLEGHLHWSHPGL